MIYLCSVSVRQSVCHALTAQHTAKCNVPPPQISLQKCVHSTAPLFAIFLTLADQVDTLLRICLPYGFFFLLIKANVVSVAFVAVAAAVAKCECIAHIEHRIVTELDCMCVQVYYCCTTKLTCKEETMAEKTSYA